MRFILVVACGGLVACDGDDTDVGALENRIAALEALVQDLQTTVTQQSTMLKSQKATIDQQATTLTDQQNTVDQAAAVLQYLKVNENDDLVFEGADVYVQNGCGTTYPPTGQDSCAAKGNLIIGYNEDSGRDLLRTGSHNLIIGTEIDYTSTGGFAVGAGHSIAGQGASICGGVNHEASGFFSSVSGGLGNKATGEYAAVAGGSGNEASGRFATVAGGSINRASGSFSSASGGLNNAASAANSVVSSGSGLTADDSKPFVNAFNP